MTSISVVAVIWLVQCLLPVTPTFTFGELISALSDIQRRGNMTVKTYIDPEAFMTTPEIVRANGYPAETHTVETEDGYFIDVHRIPSKGIPVLLMHGVFSSSAIWVENTVNISLAYLLYDVGFDVWLGNVRGNTYARKHRTLNISEKKFWNFTIDEYCQKDVAAIIDHILKKVEYQNVLYVGHSLGTTEILALLSRKPEYMQKVKSAVLLAPVSVIGNMRSTFTEMVTYTDLIEFTCDLFHIYDFLNPAIIDFIFDSHICHNITKDGLFRFTNLCEKIFDSFFGYNREQMNETRLPVYLHHTPAGTSNNVAKHLGQLIKSGKFAPFDYGSAAANNAVYGSPFPPEYDVTKINVPMSLFWCDNDHLTVPRDVKWLTDRLPNIYLNYHIPDSRFSHSDFVWAINAREILYDKVIDVLQLMWKL